jgi:hypothetical protein
MTEPLEVTDAMRKAVYAADCARSGHMYNVSNIVIHSGDNPNKLPHLSCYRCDAVWLLYPEPEIGYEPAETKLQARLRSTDPVSKRITEIRNRRKAETEGQQ